MGCREIKLRLAKQWKISDHLHIFKENSLYPNITDQVEPTSLLVLKHSQNDGQRFPDVKTKEHTGDLHPGDQRLHAVEIQAIIIF